MSMHLEFEPHSWYKGAAIKSNHGILYGMPGYTGTRWNAYYLNGMTGYIIEFAGETLSDIKEQITNYINRQNERDYLNRHQIGEHTEVNPNCPYCKETK